MASAGTAIAALVGLTALFDFFDKRLGEPDATEIRTRIESAELLPTRERLGDFLREEGQSTEGLSKSQLREDGLVFLVSVRLAGILGDTLTLRWRLYRPNGHRVRGREYDQLLGEYTPELQDHDRRAPFWVPFPPREGRWVARFTLLDPRGKSVDDLTARFAHSRD